MLVLHNLAYASVDKDLTASVSMADTAGRDSWADVAWLPQQFGHSRANTAVRTQLGGHDSSDTAGQIWPGRRGRADVAGRTMQFHQAVTAT